MHIADVHLGAAPDKGKPWSKEREQQIWNTFAKLIEIAEQKQVDLLFIAGDLFHRQPQKKELKEVNYLFSTLTHTKVVLIAGNHDYIRSSSAYLNYPWCEQVHFILDREPTEVYFPEYKTHIHGFSYHEREIKEPLYDGLEAPKDGEIHILLAHGGDEKHIPFTKQRLSQLGYRYIALGHIHKADIDLERAIINPGSPEPLDKTETGKHGYVLGEINENGRILDWFPSAAALYIPLTLRVNPNTTNMALQKFVQSFIQEKGDSHIYILKLIGQRDPDVTIQPEFLEHLGNIVEIQDQTEPQYNFEQLYQNHTYDIIGDFISALRDEKVYKDFGLSDWIEDEEVRKKALNYGVSALLKTLKPPAQEKEQERETT